MYKHTSIIGATLLAAVILTIGIIGMTYVTHNAYARGIIVGGGGHDTGTNTASNSAVISGHYHVSIDQSIFQLNSGCGAGSSCSNSGSNSVTIR